MILFILKKTYILTNKFYYSICLLILKESDVFNF